MSKMMPGANAGCACTAETRPMSPRYMSAATLPPRISLLPSSLVQTAPLGRPRRDHKPTAPVCAGDFPSPLAGEGGDPRSGEGEGFVAMSELRYQPPHLPIAAQWAPPLPQGERKFRHPL